MPVQRMKRRAPAWLFVPAGPRTQTGRPPGDLAEERGCSVGGGGNSSARTHLLLRLRERPSQWIAVDGRYVPFPDFCSAIRICNAVDHVGDTQRSSDAGRPGSGPAY